MEEIVQSRSDGTTKTHIGITVCDGPGQHRLVLTEPYHEAGRIVEIPLAEVRSVTELEPEVVAEQPRAQ